MAEEEVQNQNGGEKKDSPMVWLIITILNIAILFGLWHLYHSLKANQLNQIIETTATTTITATETANDMAIVSYTIGELIADKLDKTAKLFADEDYITAQEVLGDALALTNLALKKSSATFKDENLAKPLQEYRKTLAVLAQDISTVLDHLYKEENGDAAVYFQMHIKPDNFRQLVEDGKKFYIDLLVKQVKPQE